MTKQIINRLTNFRILFNSISRFFFYYYPICQRTSYLLT